MSPCHGGIVSARIPALQFDVGFSRRAILRDIEIVGLIYALTAVVLLILISWAGVQVMGMTGFFGIVIPYLAALLFFAGFLYRLFKWSKAPNPFRIPTTGGQQKSLNWIRHSRIDNPFTTFQTVLRMASEVFLFRSLFRDLSLRSGTDTAGTQAISYASAKWLWLFAIAFHYALFTTLFRHLHFFTSPVPAPVGWVRNLDGWFEIGIPQVMMSGLILLLAVTLLFARRIFIPRLRYISLLNDYFPLFLLMAIATTGILMRYVEGIDGTSVKELAMGLISFHPVVPKGIGVLFFIHFFLACSLAAYFPFSKLMHAGGLFFSPTRNLANNNRAFFHRNPWNRPVDFHKYADYEDQFREKMIEAGIPVEKDSALPEGKE